MGCDNPCGHGPHNSARCESLPSQIENFTTQFFGTVVKTEINGVVTWSLPCQLDVGLPANPRGVDEGLACYFLRLFADGIGGLKGDKGTPGAAGANGMNAYAVVRQSFTQPTPGNPLVQVVIFPNPSIVVGLGIFIAGSGDYTVTDVQPGGVIFAMLGSAVANPSPVVPAGALVIPSGLPGSKGDKGDPGLPGAKGDKGDPGVQGPAGSAVTVSNGFAYPGAGAAIFAVTDSYSEVSFGGLVLEFVVPETGRYLVTAVLPVATTSQVSSSPPELVYVQAKLVNSTIAADIPGSPTTTGFIFTGSVQSQATQITVNAIVAAGLGETITLVMQTSATGSGWVTIPSGSLSWVRIS